MTNEEYIRKFNEKFRDEAWYPDNWKQVEDFISTALDEARKEERMHAQVEMGLKAFGIFSEEARTEKYAMEKFLQWARQVEDEDGYETVELFVLKHLASKGEEKITTATHTELQQPMNTMTISDMRKTRRDGEMFEFYAKEGKKRYGCDIASKEKHGTPKSK